MSIPRRTGSPRFTYADYRQWTDEGRWELFEGEAVMMSPAPSRLHQTVLAELVRQIGNALLDHPCEVFPAPFDVRLAEGDEAEEDAATVLQPDLSVVCDPTRLDDAGCRGAPDWILEITSPSTRVSDEVRKRDLYERHGVGEYWIVDAKRRRVTIYRRAGEGGFGEPTVRDAEGAFGPRKPAVVEIDWDFVFR